MLSRHRNKMPTLCFVYICLMFIPAELAWFFGGMRVEPYRVFLLLSALGMAKTILTHKFTQAEYALLTYCALCSASHLYLAGVSGLQAAAILFLEVVVSYFIGLGIMGYVGTLRKVVSLIMLFFLCLVPFAIYESASGERLLHVFFANLAGTQTDHLVTENYIRFGIYRASTIFAHPILYSVIAVMYLSLLFKLYRAPTTLLFCFAIAVAIVTTVTSAGILMCCLILTMYAIQKSTRYTPNIYKLIGFAVPSLYIFLFFASNQGPMTLLLGVISLDPWTAYTRQLQWDFATQAILQSPLLGIGMSNWPRPAWLSDSIDSYWLITALRHGLPALIALAIFFILSLKQYWTIFHRTHDWLYFCFLTSISAFVLAAFTVDYFDRAQFMLFFTIGLYNSFTLERVVSRTTVNSLPKRNA